MAEPQKSVPNPINKSLVKNPIEILNNDKINKGNPIRHEPSCAFNIIERFPLGSAKKTKNNNLIE